MSEQQPETASEVAPETFTSQPPARPSLSDRPPFRTRTVVFGLILLVVSVCVLAGQVFGAHVNPAAVALGLMVAAGLLLIAGSGRRQPR